MAYTNSKLATVKVLNTQLTSTRTHAIDTITIHCMANQLSAERCGNLCQLKKAAPNYGVGVNGEIGLYVQEKYKSNCSGNADNDNRAVTIEVASEATSPYAVNAKAYNALVQLVTDICARNGIKKLKWSASKTDRVNHRSGCNMTVHRDFVNTACPGEYIYSRMLSLANSVNLLLARRTVSPATTFTNNKFAWDFLISKAGFSKESAASCIGFWLAENGYSYGANYNNVTPPYPPGTSNPYKYLDRELFPGEIEGYYLPGYPGNDVVMSNLPNSLISYSNSYLSEYDYGGYCGIGVGSWTFKYGSGALIKYAKEKNKSWDDLELQLNFAIDAYSGKYAPYGSIGNPSAYAKRNTSHGCTENNFWPGIAWFVAWEWPAHYGDINACRSHFGDSYEAYARKVYKEFKDSPIGEYSSSSTSYTSTAQAISDPSSVINADAIDALIISLDSSVKHVDYKKLLDDSHISGVMLYVGSYFTPEHKVSVKYRNPNLQTQVDEVVKAGLRFGLVVDVRAKTIAEAKLECEQLYYVVSKYPPALGLWLHIMFTRSKTTNHKILDYYVSELKRWGFAKGCGLYCTQKELEKIDWSKYKEDFFLWYINRFTKVSEMPQLNSVLGPEFFKR